MKRFALILTTAALATSQFAFSQITIGADKLPVAGDCHITTSMDTIGVSEGQSGANRNWNFAALRPNGSADTILYIAAASTPYASNFPSATLASYNPDPDPTYSYSATSSGRITILGMANSEFAMHYSDPEIQMTTPFTYGTNASDAFAGTYDDGAGFVLRNRGTISIIGDAYGTITLPNGQTHQALRIRFVRNSTDSLFYNGAFMQVSTMQSTSYEWFIASYKFPVLQVAYHIYTVGGNVQTTKLVEFNAPTASDVKIEKREGVANEFRLEQNYPNPFNPTTTIGFAVAASGRVSLKVFNVIGEEVATLVSEELPAGIYAVPFDAKGLASGTYIYRLQVGDAVQTRKMSLMK